MTSLFLALSVCCQHSNSSSCNLSGLFIRNDVCAKTRPGFGCYLAFEAIISYFTAQVMLVDYLNPLLVFTHTPRDDKWKFLFLCHPPCIQMLGMLKQLVYLDVSKNNLEMVDEQICSCENLQDLLLSNNALTQLPGSIGKHFSVHSHLFEEHLSHSHFVSALVHTFFFPGFNPVFLFCF